MPIGCDGLNNTIYVDVFEVIAFLNCHIVLVLIPLALSSEQVDGF